MMRNRPRRARISRARIHLAVALALVAAAAWPQAPAGLKGVWEPVSYGADLVLNDVFFVTPEIGYVSGAAGTILKTADAGATWTAQLGGDPASEENPIERLFFVSPTAGWATQSAPSNRRHLYRTTDGEYWETVGNIEEHYTDMAFASESEGIYVVDSQIMHTVDAGRTWNETYRCAVTAQVAGLTRQIQCRFAKVHFATPAVVYALGDAFDLTAAIVVKSEDGGASWSVAALLENHSGWEGGIFFVDANTGFLATRDAQAALRTTDGGQTWSGLAATSLARQMIFADPEVGWAMRYNQLTYTVDGGRRWASRTIDFPAFPTAFSLPRRDVGYAVGEHGMIYRYRTLPQAAAVAPSSIAFAAMPPLANGVIAELAEIEAGLGSIEAAVAAAGAQAVGAATQAAAQSWAEANIPGFGEFETTLASVASGLPELGRRHRNLNLLGEGLRLSNELTGQGSGLGAALASLQQAADDDSASAALREVQSQVEAAKASVTAFETLPAR